MTIQYINTTQVNKYLINYFESYDQLIVHVFFLLFFKLQVAVINADNNPYLTNIFLFNFYF